MLRVLGKSKDFMDNKGCIVWGATRRTAVNCASIYLDDREVRVIDSQREKHGQVLCIGKKEFVIESSDILNNLDSKAWCLAISSQNYYEEIRDLIRASYAGWDASTINFDQLYRTYESLDDLFKLDYVFHKRMLNACILGDIEAYQNTAKNIVSSFLSCSGYEYFCLPSASNVVIMIQGDADSYVLKFPSFDGSHSLKQIKAILNNKEKIIGKDKLVLYEDSEGFVLSRKAQVIENWEQEEVKQALSILKQIEKSDVLVDKNIEPLLFVSERHVKKFCNLEEKRIQTLVNDIKCHSEKKRISHGDTHCGNFLKHENEVYLIDWDTLAMRDDLWDVLFFIGDLWYGRAARIYKNWEDMLLEYLDGKIDDVMMRYARAKMIGIMIKIEDVFSKAGVNTDFITGEIKKSVNEYVALYKL
ncbi:MAG: phosphotransferase [Clostridiales bacterium]|nr:phosphotransferase [Clostridiales bacterium]